MNYIENRTSESFFVSIKGHCVVSEGTINFLPVIRNCNITTNEETIGSYTYNYMKANNLKTDQQERKLTQMIDTHGEFHVF
jgi:hypothetical protein